MTLAIVIGAVLSTLVASGGAQNQSDLAAWHNMAVTPARVGRARPWTREFPIAGFRRAHPPFGWIVLDRVVIEFGQGEIVALEPTSGKTLWHRASPFGTDSLAEQGMLLGSLILLRNSPGEERTTFAALDSRTGKEVWRSTSDGYCVKFQPAGGDLVCEVRSKDPVNGSHPVKELAILDGKTGTWKCRLSQTDEAANRKALQKVCPILVDQWVLFGNRRTRNGIYVDGEKGWGLSAWIVGDALYAYSSLDDFPMDGLRGDTGLSEYALADLLPTDLWQGKAMGRRLNFGACHYYGPIEGIYKGRLLTSFTEVRGKHEKLTRVSSIGTLPTSGPPDYQVIAQPVPSLSLAPGGATTLGFLYLTPGESYPSRGPYPEEAFARRPYLLTARGWVAQRPLPRPPSGMPPWVEVGVCEDGLVLASWLQNWDKPGKFYLHLEPFVTRQSRRR